MSKINKELKRKARAGLKGNYGLLIKAFLWTQMIVLLLEFPFSMLQTEMLLTMENLTYLLAEILIAVLSIVLVCGQYHLHLSIARGGKPAFKEFWLPLKAQPDRYILANFLQYGILFLCLLPMLIGLWFCYPNPSGAELILALLLCLLSLILCLAVSLNYDLVFFLLLDEATLSPIEAFRKSRSLMCGHRGEYLYLKLSFLGYLLLDLLSLGIATLWITPYYTQTQAQFYLSVRK